MIRSVPLSTQVYNHLFPSPQKGKDPMTWHEHVQKHLVPEIRMEVHQFYGPESRTLEAKYPGMDYSSSCHRMRLGRYRYHRQLFRAMDALNLTPWEIYTLCDWEGTLLVKCRYEQQQGVTLRDTTGDDVAVASARVSVVGSDEDLCEEENEEGDQADEEDYTKDDDDDDEQDEEDEDDDERDGTELSESEYDGGRGVGRGPFMRGRGSGFDGILHQGGARPRAVQEVAAPPVVHQSGMLMDGGHGVTSASAAA